MSNGIEAVRALLTERANEAPNGDNPDDHSYWTGYKRSLREIKALLGAIEREDNSTITRFTARVNLDYYSRSYIWDRYGQT